jgi:hypothetical protein
VDLAQDGGRVEPTEGLPVDWAALLDWYVGATDLIGDLEACWEMVDSMLCGTDVTNLVVAEALHARTMKSERWLVSHPCPEHWSDEHLAAIVHTFMEIGRMIVEVGGRQVDFDQTELVEKVDQARLMMGEVNELMARLTYQP